MNDIRQAQLNELYALSRKDPDVKLMLNAMTARHGCDLFTFVEEHPEAFDDLYEAAFTMVDQLGGDTDTYQ